MGPPTSRRPGRGPGRFERDQRASGSTTAAFPWLFGSRLGVDNLTAEPAPEHLSVVALPKAKDVVVLAVAPKGVATWAEGQPVAKQMDGVVPGTEKLRRGQGNLMRPVAINLPRLEFALATDHLFSSSPSLETTNGPAMRLAGPCNRGEGSVSGTERRHQSNPRLLLSKRLNLKLCHL